MQSVFLELVKLSLIGSLFAAAVMLVRLIFRKAPKWLFCILWGIVALRLICPISIESNVSLVPDRLATGQIITNVGNEYIGDVDIIYESNAGYSNAIEAGRQPIYSNDGYYVVTEKDSLEAPKTVGQTVYPILSWIWLAGVILMLTYTAVSYLLLRKKMEEATQLRNNIWQCEQVDSPFVLGFIKPRIYLPYAISDSDMANVIAHEQAHIQRKDHWWKPIGFLLLSIHWFNPVLWLAYILLCRDIEAACDEKVIKHMEKDEMRAYSTALLHCSVHRRRIAACPLAFGEVGAKERIKRIMNYKKPAFWIVIGAIFVSIIVACCFLTEPTKSEAAKEYTIASYLTSAEQTKVIEAYNKSNERIAVTVNFDATEGPTQIELAYQYKKNAMKEWTQTDPVLMSLGKSTTFTIPADNHFIITAKSLDGLSGNVTFGISEDPCCGDANSADPGLLDEHITTDTPEMSGMVAKSGKNAVPMLSFPRSTSDEDYADLIHWLRIDPDSEDRFPFSIWKDGKEIRGTYSVGEAITNAPLMYNAPLGADPRAYLFQNADPNCGYIVRVKCSTESDTEVYVFGVTFNDFNYDNSKLLSLVNEIASNPDCAASSNPFTYIDAKKSKYHEILTYGTKAVDFFVEQLRAGENGLPGYIMAVACADITGIADKYDGAEWSTAQEWLSLYDSSEQDIIIPKAIVTDYLSGEQAKLRSFGYAVSKGGVDHLDCGVSLWMAAYGADETLVLDGKNGQNQILLAPQGFAFHQYKIYLSDGTVYDSGSRAPYDSYSQRVMLLDQGLCLIAPSQPGEYFYEIELAWPKDDLVVSYGLKIVMTGEENDYDRALDSVFAAYGNGNPLIAVSLVDKYTYSDDVVGGYTSFCYLFKIENIPNAPVWVEVSQATGWIRTVSDPNPWLINPPYVENWTQGYSENRVTRVWDRYHPGDSEEYQYFSINVPALDDALLERREDCKIYLNGEHLFEGSGNYCESVYLTDLTGDGIPELCFGMSRGSGITDRNIEIIDYATRQCIFSLSNRMIYDYYLFERNGELCVKVTGYAKDDTLRTGVLKFNGSRIFVQWDTDADKLQNANEIPGAVVHVVDIWDRTKTEELICSSAEEKFWEDDKAEYYFGCIKSHYIMVMDSTGRTVDVVTALEEGLITIETLGYYGIAYGTMPKTGANP